MTHDEAASTMLFTEHTYAQLVRFDNGYISANNHRISSGALDSARASAALLLLEESSAGRLILCRKNVFMELTLEIQSPNDLQLILQVVRLLPTVKVITEQKKQPPMDETASNEHDKGGFLRYYGSLSTGMTLDEKINQMRAEWDRDFS